MEFVYQPEIVREIVNATQFINCYAMFNAIKNHRNLNEQDFDQYIDYCEENKYIEKKYFPFNNKGVEEIICECMITSVGEEFLQKKS